MLMYCDLGQKRYTGLLLSTLRYSNFHELTLLYTANIFEVIFTVLNCVPLSTVILLYGLHLIAAPSMVE